MRVKFAIYTILFLLAIIAWCLGCQAFGQEVESAAKVVDSTPWQTELQAKLDAAGALAAVTNRSIVVTEQPGRYEFVSLDIPPHVALVFGTGFAPREGDLVYVGGDNPDRPLITVRGGYGTGLAGCQIRDRTQTRSGLVAIKVDNAINPSIQNIRVDLRGEDTAGIIIAGRESVVVERAELRAAMPVIIEWGDNVVVRDADLGCSGRAKFGVDAVVTLKTNPHHIAFEGSQTWQGGTWAIRGVTSDDRTGQGLSLSNVRWEQSTSINDSSKPGILIECEGRSFEALTQINCRWSARKNPDTVVRSNPSYPLVPRLTELGCFKPKK